MKVGILSLQGSFFDHQKSLDLISLDSLLVKTPNDLDNESNLIEFNNRLKALMIRYVIIFLSSVKKKNLKFL